MKEVIYVNEEQLFLTREKELDICCQENNVCR